MFFLEWLIKDILEVQETTNKKATKQNGVVIA